MTELLRRRESATTLWIDWYGEGYDAQTTGARRADAWNYDGPYRLGWFEASQGMPDRRTANLDEDGGPRPLPPVRVTGADG